MKLVDLVTLRIMEDGSDLQNCPVPIVREAIRAAFRLLSTTATVPGHIHATELGDIDLEFCEACGNGIDPGRIEGAVVDSDGIWLCGECKEDV